MTCIALRIIYNEPTVLPEAELAGRCNVLELDVQAWRDDRLGRQNVIQRATYGKNDP